MVEKKEIMRFRSKKAAVVGSDFSITPKWRPRCQIWPNHGKKVEGPRPKSRLVEVPNMKNTKDTFKIITKNKQDSLISHI